MQEITTRYHVSVLAPDDDIKTQKSVFLSTLEGIWAEIAELAEIFREPGLRIRVTNAAGEIVVLLGIATARRTFGLMRYERSA